MSGKYSVSALAVMIAAALIVACALGPPAQAYRICTFKGTVVENGWRTMTVKSGGQCAKVNVGWRTKYIPNRRPCIGERVAVDFLLDEGYMKATKVVSLTPQPSRVTCYPPPPPRGTICRSIPEERREVCPSPKPICSRTPPGHVSGKYYPAKKRIKARKPRKKTVRKPKPKPSEEASKPPETLPEPTPDPPTPQKSVSGEVVASSPKSLSVRVTDDAGAVEIVNVRVGLKTKFIPFRRPAVGEKVKVDYMLENGAKFGYTVQVVQ
jgi:hypothetical protein